MQAQFSLVCQPGNNECEIFNKTMKYFTCHQIKMNFFQSVHSSSYVWLCSQSEAKMSVETTFNEKRQHMKDITSV